MSWSFLRNVLLKALALFLFANLVFAAWMPLDGLGRISAYNVVFPGRERFPFGEDAQHAYNLSLYNLEAMFASHVVSAPYPKDEFRLFVLGDSSTWGTLLRPEETLAGQINAMKVTCQGRPVRAYNLGYPTLSLTKDLMALDSALPYHPDAVLWLVTLESFPREAQLASPLAANNPGRIQRLAERYNLNLPLDQLQSPAFLQRTLVGQRRPLADLMRLQFYGVMWSATGIDQAYPGSFKPALRDLEADDSFHGRKPPALDNLSIDVLEAGMRAAGDAPALLVNEPVMASTGANSAVRYNYYYPRWAYDKYRGQLQDLAGQNDWRYLDLWNLASEGEFTNSAIHLTPPAEARLAQQVARGFQTEICNAMITK